MAETTITFGSTSGLHARPAATFVKAAAASGATVHLHDKNGNRANAAGLLAVISLGVKQGDELTLTVTGDNEDRILEELGELLASNLDEA